MDFGAAHAELYAFHAPRPLEDGGLMKSNRSILCSPRPTGRGLWADTGPEIFFTFWFLACFRSHLDLIRSYRMHAAAASAPPRLVEVREPQVRVYISDTLLSFMCPCEKSVAVGGREHSTIV